MLAVVLSVASIVLQWLLSLMVVASVCCVLEDCLSTDHRFSSCGDRLLEAALSIMEVELENDDSTTFCGNSSMRSIDAEWVLCADKLMDNLWLLLTVKLFLFEVGGSLLDLSTDFESETEHSAVSLGCSDIKHHM